VLVGRTTVSVGGASVGAGWGVGAAGVASPAGVLQATVSSNPHKVTIFIVVFMLYLLKCQSGFLYVVEEGFNDWSTSVFPLQWNNACF
jgi:hypothetical protein